MARLARVVIPGHPHHVTQRGNGRSRTFFDDGDYALYRDLLAALARVHRSYAGTIQARRKRTSHFWQGRFGAVAMDERHLAAALRYVSFNPARARLVQRAQDWRWASTRAHLRWRDDGLTALVPIPHRFPDFADLLTTEPELNLFGALRSAESIGRPLGDDRFLARIER
ncbi:hypothetical protein, partial [Bradyrhizobium sp.]|uniref:hypothetical protein n=1 Tax=Bradyrhizobium sp. TaxID=376 RepID=UPI0007C89BB6